MTKITIIIESTFSGPASGFYSIQINDSETVKELIRQFCNTKDVTHDRNYALITQNNVLLVNAKPISDFFIHDGQVLKLIKTNPGSTKLVFRQWMMLAVLGIFIAIVGLVASVLLYAVFGNVPNNYALVIAAETTQTDIRLYSWPGENLQNTEKVVEFDACSALGSLVQVEATSFKSYFDACFDDVHQSVLEDSKKDVVAIFGATEEIEFLNQTDPNSVERMLTGVPSYLTNSDWKFKNIMNVGIIPGAEKGVSKWISANAIDGKISDVKESIQNMIGIMELGDRATQISFQVSDTYRNSPSVYPITLFGNEYYVFSKSFTCYGVQEALRRYRALLLIEHSNFEETSNNITSPCEPLGWSFEAPSLYFSSACVDFTVADPPENEKTWKFEGSGNYSECERIVSKLLDYDECITTNMGHCLSPEKIPVDLVGERNFYAFAAYSSISQSLGIQPGASLFEALRHVKVMCDYSVASFNEAASSSTNKNSMAAFEQLCFQGQYMLSLLTQIYEINSETKWSQISFSNADQETSMQWTYGYMINATDLISPLPRKPKLPVVSFSLLVVAFIFLLFLSVGFIVHGCNVRKNLQGYQRKHVLRMDRQLEKFIDPNIVDYD